MPGPRAVQTDRQTTETGSRVRWRLAIYILAVFTLAVALSQTSRLPGPLGEVLRANITADHDTTALFYTEVNGWKDWGGR
ncbi:MAG: hypothetical protein CL484_03395 [Acidobacteria bacterium]|nr:hypothetical protein [Acidobacteriota bacterium]